MTLLASDAERDGAIALLREATVQGRLTLEDFGVRASRALECRTRAELSDLLQDLPPLVSSSPTVPAAGVREVAVFGSVERTGRWRVGHTVSASAVFGTITLDLRGAVIDEPVVTIYASVFFGSVDVIVPEGVEVLMEGAAVLGSRAVKLRYEPPPAGAPVVRVVASIFLGSVTVRGGKGLLDRALERFGVSLPPPSSAPPP